MLSNVRGSFWFFDLSSGISTPKKYFDETKTTSRGDLLIDNHGFRS